MVGLKRVVYVVRIATANEPRQLLAKEESRVVLELGLLEFDQRVLVLHETAECGCPPTPGNEIESYSARILLRR